MMTQARVHALQPRHGFTRLTPMRIDGSRVAGYAVAITLNAALLLALLLPMRIPPLSSPASDDTPVLKWIEREPVEVKPIVAPITPPSRPDTPRSKPQGEPQPQPPAPVLVEHGVATPDLPPVPDATATPSIEPAIATPPAVRLEYLQAPPPPYPRASLRMRSEGTVLLEVLVDVDGRPLRVKVRDSSGDRRLDAAAREQVLRHWRFRPAMHGGHAVQAIGLVPIDFNLGR